jgi:hypothetical protein
MQTKAHSLLESMTTVGIGFIVAVCSQYLIYPLFGIDLGFGENLGVASCFTVISLIRSYIVRRVFNSLHRREGVLEKS